MASVPQDIAARLDDSVFGGRDRLAVERPGWPGDLVAVDTADMFDGLDDSQLLDRVVEVWNQANDLVAGLRYQPIIAETKFSIDGLSDHYDIPAFVDPTSVPADVAAPQWGLHDWLTSELFVPEYVELTWELRHHREPGALVRPRDEICTYLETRLEQDYGPLGQRPTPEEIHTATDPDGQPIRSLGMAHWWMHRWAMGALGGEVLVAANRNDRGFLLLEWPTLVLLPTPSETTAVGGLLPTGSAEFSFEHGSEAWPAFVDKWARLWGARQMSAGYMSTFLVERPPAAVEEAVPLAIEHYVFCDQAPRQGLSVYEYAYGLVGQEHWTLSVKP